MASLEVDASNPCVPPSHPLVASVPPLPSTERGRRLIFDGSAGRINGGRPVLLYAMGRLVVVRELDGDLPDAQAKDRARARDWARAGGHRGRWKGHMERPVGVKAFVYRGHTAQVTAAKFSPSGCYVASADVRGQLRVWAYDNEEHLCKLELPTAMAGPIRDISWDFDSKRLCIVGESSKTDASSECARVIQWDTGVTCGELGQHTRNRALSCAFRPGRPMRIATGGGDDSRVLFNKGPPFVRVIGGGVSEKCHERGAVHCLKYSPDGSRIASVGTDRSVAFYDGKNMALIRRVPNVHANSIYSCDWTSDGAFLLTCSADGTARLLNVSSGSIAHTWNVLEERKARVLGVDSAVPPPPPSDAATPIGSPWAMPTPSSERRGSMTYRPDMGGMLMGCAIVDGDVPVAACLNGEIAMLLPVPSGVAPSLPSSATAGGARIEFLTGHQCSISAMAVDHRGGRVFTGDTDGVICGWKLIPGGHGGGRDTGPSFRALGRVQREGGGGGASEGEAADFSLMDRVHTGSITAMVCRANGGGEGGSGVSVLSAGWDDAIRIGDGTAARWRLDVEAQPNAMARGTEVIAIVTVKGLLLMCDDAIVSSLIELPYVALSVCVSADDTTVVVGGEDCSIHIYSVDSSSGPQDLRLNEIRVLDGGHLKAVHAVSLSPDGTYLASADVRDVCVWKKEGPSTWTPVIGKSRWCFHTQRIVCLAWSPDGSVLASAGNDDSIYLWSLAKKTTRVHYSFAHRGGISGLEFVNKVGGGDGLILISSGSDGCINQWDVTDDVAQKFG